MPTLTEVRDVTRDVLAIDYLQDFVRQAWPLVDPKPYLHNWHIPLLCDELEMVSRGETRELVICIPPGHAKSLLVSVFWPAWRWLHDPSEKVLFVANADDLVKRDSWKTRLLLSSPWYQRLVALTGKTVIDKRSGEDRPWRLAPDQNEKIDYANESMGRRWCKAIGGAIQGQRGDGLVLDDPYDAKEVLGSPSQVAQHMNYVVEVYDTVLETRAERWKVLMMQRLHERDLAGVLIARGARSVVIPMEYELDRADCHPKDPRTERGELLFPALYRRLAADGVAATWVARRARLGSRARAAQDQQRPMPGAGGLFKREWFRHRYQGDPQVFARGLDEQAITVDCTFKVSDDTDFVVMQVFGRKRAEPARKYLLDQIRARMDYPDTKRALRAFCAKWRKARMKLIEEKANGAALIADLQHEIPGLVPYDPKVSKEARAQMAAPEWEAGNVWLPEDQWAPWISDYVEEHVMFPAGANDDQLDASNQLIIRWGEDEGATAESIREDFAFLGRLRPKR